MRNDMNAWRCVCVHLLLSVYIACFLFWRQIRILGILFNFYMIIFAKCFVDL